MESAHLIFPIFLFSLDSRGLPGETHSPRSRGAYLGTSHCKDTFFATARLSGRMTRSPSVHRPHHADEGVLSGFWLSLVVEPAEPDGAAHLVFLVNDTVVHVPGGDAMDVQAVSTVRLSTSHGTAGRFPLE